MDEGAGERDSEHANAPDVGLLHAASYRLLRYGSVPTFPRSALPA